MRPSKAFERPHEENREIVAKRGFTNPRVRGSVAVGVERENSDLDILVDIFPGTTLFDLGILQFELQELVGIELDLNHPGDFEAMKQAEAVTDG